ncbi:MAG: type III polyketide synthase [Phycisphaerae bacterium]|nr:type III polyketide synthase [Phycisphaerae bacterium]
MTARLASIGLAVPTGRLGIDRAISLASVLAAEGVRAETIEAIHRRSGIDERGCAIIGPDGEQTLYSATRDRRGPTTSQRLSRYTAHATALAVNASRDALHRARVDPDRITHLITVSCSGFDAPGFDQSLMLAVGLRSTVRRTHIGFMGCHAAVNALATAEAFARADAHAVVLLCCVEVCSLHYHYSERVDQLVANALFSDGAAAAIVAATAPEDAPTLAGFSSAIFDHSAGEMSWRIGDHGFEMTLSPSIPDTLRRVVPGWVGSFLDLHAIARRDVGGWAIHPGGPRIVRAVTDALGLDTEAGAASLEVLRHHGNMSSPTVLFILRRLWDAGFPKPWVALAFGPGVAGEALIVR